MYVWKTIRTRFYFQPVLTYWNMLNDHKQMIKWKAKNTPVGTIPKSNIKIVERSKFDTTNTQIHYLSLSWIGTIYGPKPPCLIIFFHLLMFYICFVFPAASRFCSIIWIVTVKLSFYFKATWHSLCMEISFILIPVNIWIKNRVSM